MNNYVCENLSLMTTIRKKNETLFLHLVDKYSDLYTMAFWVMDHTACSLQYSLAHGMDAIAEVNDVQKKHV